MRSHLFRSTLAVTLIAGLVACGKSTPEPTVAPTTSPAPACPEPQASSEPAPSPAAPASELGAMTLPPRPDWTDKYAGSSPDERFLRIDALMRAHELDRARAVEVQNHFRDLTRAEPQGDREAQYAEALRRAKEGIFEDRREVERLAEAKFIVVFDLDETLYDQYIRDAAVAEACHDFSASSGGKTRKVKLNPGWKTAIDRIAELGGEVVLFSANVDDVCWANFSQWMVDDKPITDHPAIAGVLTNSHLVLQPKQAGDPVVEPSKDLRILDPDLKRVIIVDDNPTRLFQPRNVRVYKKFQADVYCATSDPVAKKAYAKGMDQLVDELEDTLRYMKGHPDASFVDAYLPYSMIGRVAVDWLERKGLRRAQAVAHVRADPSLVEPEF